MGKKSLNLQRRGLGGIDWRVSWRGWGFLIPKVYRSLWFIYFHKMANSHRCVNYILGPWRLVGRQSLEGIWWRLLWWISIQSFILNCISGVLVWRLICGKHRPSGEGCSGVPFWGGGHYSPNVSWWQESGPRQVYYDLFGCCVAG